jgi:hypothetical protein
MSLKNLTNMFSPEQKVTRSNRVGCILSNAINDVALRLRMICLTLTGFFVRGTNNYRNC